MKRRTGTMRSKRRWQRIRWVVAVGALAMLGAWQISVPDTDRANETVVSVLVQGPDVATVAAAVRAAGGEVTHELGIINAVAAEMAPRTYERLAADSGLRLYADSGVETAAPKKRKRAAPPADVFYTTQIGASQLHDEGTIRRGVGIAVLDSGLWTDNGLLKDPDGNRRVPLVYDAIRNRYRGGSSNTDGNGHGTHVVSIVANSEVLSGGGFGSVAPGATLVPVKAFDANGQGSYADVIRGLDWIVANKDTYGIRVLNLSFSAPPRSHYWNDPLNQAVMRAWQAGIVVVASAGNGGPNPMTVGVPATCRM